MDEYAREMMDLKTLVTRTLEKKGVLAKIRAELRASVFEAIEEEDRAIENENSGLPPALLGSCNDRAKQLHASPTGKLLTALVCEYQDWAQLGHTLKVYLPECNLEKDFWKAELRDFSGKDGFDINRNNESRPMLLDVLENLLQARGGRKLGASDVDSVLSVDARNTRRQSSSTIVGGLPPLGRHGQTSQSSDRRLGSSATNFRKDEHNWRYDNDLSEDVLRASNALENIQLDRKACTLSTSWRADELEVALMEMVKQDNRRHLSARVEQLEKEISELWQALTDKQEQEQAMLQVLMRVEQEQKVTEDARMFAEKDAAEQK